MHQGSRAAHEVSKCAPYPLANENVILPFVDIGLTNGNSFRKTTTSNANDTHVFGICLFQTRKR